MFDVRNSFQELLFETPADSSIAQAWDFVLTGLDNDLAFSNLYYSQSSFSSWQDKQFVFVMNGLDRIWILHKIC